MIEFLVRVLVRLRVRVVAIRFQPLRYPTLGFYGCAALTLDQARVQR